MNKLIYKKQFTLILLVLLSFSAAVAQNPASFTLKGRVTDVDNEPVIGATVVLEGTNLGNTTDINGDYTIEGSIPEGDYTVVFSFVGFSTIRQQTRITSGASNLNARMSEDALNLNEFVVLGSTLLQERKQLGNAISTVRGEDIERSGTNNSIQALQGKVAGAQITQNSGDPAGGITVRLRGAKSLLGSSEPLYVVDGVISNNGTVNITNANVNAGATSAIGQNRMADLNPNDIESVSVLNGSAAAALYGSRASNGVVIITTKRGKSGKPKISFTTSVSTFDLRKRSFFSTFGKQFHPSDTTTGFIPGTTTSRDPLLQTLFPAAKGGSVLTDSIAVWGGKIDVNRLDYQDYIFRQAMGLDNNLSISGGNDNTRYFASASYSKNEGIIKNTDFRRLSARVRLDQRVTPWLDASLGLTYSNSFSNELPNGNVFFSPTNSINITNNIFKIDEKDALGNYKAVENLGRVNPLDVIDYIKNNQVTNRTIADLQLTARPFEGMTISYVLGVDNTNQLGRNFSPIYPYTVAIGSFDKGYAANNTSLTLLLNSDINAAYSKKFGIFSTNTVAGFSYNYARDQITFTQGRDLGPFVTTVNGATVILPPSLVDAPSNIAGGFLQETFGVNDRLFLTLSGRIDASSRYPKATRQNFYPKVGVSYLASSEPYWANLKKVVPQFRLRGSWGQTGNLTGYGVYDRFQRFSLRGFNGRTAAISDPAIADPNVKVELNTETEIGTDFTLFNDLVNVGFSWYKQDITSLLYDIGIAPTQGGTSSKTNVGELENKGYELTLGVTPLKTKDMRLEVFGTFSHNDNLVTKLSTGAALNPIASPTGAPIFLIEGAPVGVFYGNFYARDANGDILNRPIKVSLLKDGKVVETQVNSLPQVERGNVQGAKTPLEYTPFRNGSGQAVITGTGSTILRKVLGNPNPRNIWSAGTSFKFKGLTFSALLDAVSGVEIWNADKRTRNNVGIGQLSEQELKGELPRGTVAAYAGIDEFRVDDASFVKLRELSLSYDLGNILKIKGMSNLELSVTGRNLYSWDTYFGYDPETNATGQGSVARGIDFGNSPIPRSVQFALKASF
jgi:TonB-linked SusC/RagA family outer membrane protein